MASKQVLPNRTYILHLYRSLLRASQKFSSYNFRDYAYRKIRDSYHVNKNETDSDRIIQLVGKAERELGDIINSLQCDGNIQSFPLYKLANICKFYSISCNIE
ncbi:LYR motif-containing protein 4 [Rhizophagus clarus]|uniref:LYR motif-containing protein 4 n=1 Tax=Rhizophagus clarus TaxID=94130 RepID=A0A8H3QX51_9GLOM|nr:LYR motif-containing protein 4 [Rhizophagus clarus]